MFCVKCGRETDSITDGLCLDCYLHNRTFFVLPPVITLMVCRDCGAVRTGKRWYHTTTEHMLDQHLRQTMTTAVLEQQQFVIDIDDKTVTCTGMFQGHPIKETYSLEVRQRPSLCDECGKIRGGYFEAVIQVRKHGRDMTDKDLQTTDDIVFAAAVIDGRNYLTRREPQHGGLDYYLGDKSRAAAIARRIADAFNAAMDVSYSLTGMRDGQEVYRNTILVRIPSYGKDDFVELDNKVFQVMEIGKRVTLRNLQTGASHRVYRSKMVDIPVLPVEKQDAVIVSRTESELQILDPETFETVTIATPPLPSLKDTIPIIKWKGRLYVAVTL